MKYKDGQPIGRTKEKIENQKKAVERLKRFTENKDLELAQISTSTERCLRSTGGFEEPYSGKYGTGFKVHIPLWSRANKYHRVYYFVYKTSPETT